MEALPPAISVMAEQRTFEILHGKHIDALWQFSQKENCTIQLIRNAALPMSSISHRCCSLLIHA